MQEWKPSQRVGTPKIELSKKDASRADVHLKVHPRPPGGWEEFFNHWLQMNGIQFSVYSWGMDGISGVLQTAVDGIETMVGEVDKAIDAANDHYRDNLLPVEQAKARKAQSDKDARVAQQQALNERAANLARPDPDKL